MVPSTEDVVGFGEFGLVGVMLFGLLMIAIVAIVALVKVFPRLIDAWTAWNQGVVETSKNNVKSAELTSNGMKQLGEGMEKMAESMKHMDENNRDRHRELLARLPHPHRPSPTYIEGPKQ